MLCLALRKPAPLSSPIEPLTSQQTVCQPEAADHLMQINVTSIPEDPMSQDGIF